MTSLIYRISMNSLIIYVFRLSIRSLLYRNRYGLFSINYENLSVTFKVLTTGTLPTEEYPLQAILDLLKHTQSTCASVIFDDLHAPYVLYFIAFVTDMSFLE